MAGIWGYKAALSDFLAEQYWPLGGLLMTFFAWKEALEIAKLRALKEEAL